MKRLIVALALGACLTACHETLSAPEPDIPELGSHGEGEGEGDYRPGAWASDTVQWVDSVLSEAELRYSGPNQTLRYDHGGVMIVNHAGGAGFSFYDIDGNASAELSWYKVRESDSILSEAELKVNGEWLTIVYAKRMKVTADGTAWLVARDLSDAMHVMVVPGGI